MIILMGLAGSGKSTQGNILAGELDGVWLSAGQVLRDTDNEEAHELQRAGELVPDEITIPLMAQAIAEARSDHTEVVIDGYPRTVTQANWVVEHVANDIEVVIWIDVPKDELFTRMKLRGRADDASEESIRERFRLVEQNIYTICAILQSNGIKITKINGLGTPEEVTARLHDVIRKVKSGEGVEIFDAKAVANSQFEE